MRFCWARTLHDFHEGIDPPLWRAAALRVLAEAVHSAGVLPLPARCVMAHNFDGRVVIVTGAGGGIGRNYCLEFAKQGAKVVVCDLGNSVDGSGNSTGPADDVVGEIEAMGGEAMANYSDVSSWEDCEALIKATIDRFGDLHALVCNAGILRDRSLANSETTALRLY